MAVYGQVLTYEYEDDNGEKKQLKLVFNALTIIKYYNYVGRDFMSDFIDMAIKVQKNAQGLRPELRQKFNNGEEVTFDEYNADDIKFLSGCNFAESLEFFINVIAAMIATREHPKVLDFCDIIGNEIPLMLLYDTTFMNELINFMVFAVKKNNLHPKK